MALRLCPSCQRPVDAEAMRCPACGLGIPQEDTVPAAFDASMRWSPPEVTPRVLPPALTLRPLLGEELPEIGDLISPLDELVTTDPPRPPAAAQAPAVLGALVPINDQTRKAAKRAAVRRARQRATGGTEDCTDVLVLEPDEAGLATLRDLLESFGFAVHVARDVPQAIEMASDRCFAAAFVDIALDDAAGSEVVDLCRALKAVRRSPDGAPAALMLYSDHVSPTARIRAQLAGCDAQVTKPAQRGDLARALESCAVALPSDARRG